MTDNSDLLNWGWLPYRPEKFFGLSDHFDRTELKRRYSQLIRQFKPEKFPEEFQQIRAAYEALDHRFRSGHLPAESSGWGAVPPNLDSRPGLESWSSADLEGRSVNQNKRPRSTFRSEASLLRDRVKAEPLDAVYDELAAKQHKQPFDFYALAVMSDIVPSGSETRLADWLLAGLREHRNDLGLMGLLREFLGDPIPPNQIAELLVNVSEVIRDAKFFSLTEGLWKRFVQEADFPTFRQTLEKCESNLSGFDLEIRLPFYVEMLKFAIWKADTDWVEESVNFIEENFHRINWLQFDVDLLAIMQEYARQRSQFLNGDPLRIQMDDVLQSYFRRDVLADVKMIRCQVSIADNLSSLSRAFPNEGGKQQFEPFYLIWSTVSQLVLDRNFHSVQSQPEEGIWRPRLLQIMDRLNHLTWTTREGWSSQIKELGYYGTIGLSVLALIILALLFGKMVYHLSEWSGMGRPELAAVSAGAAFVMLGLWTIRLLKRKFLDDTASNSMKETERIWFEKYSRPRVAEFMNHSGIDYSTVRDWLQAIDTSNMPLVASVVRSVSRDYALAIFSIAQPFKV